METKDRDRGIDRRVFRNIRFNARRLARLRSVPGMEVDDYEQDFFLDLMRRQPSFDPTRASYPTFADRVIGHRAITLTTPTVRLRGERNTISIDAPVIDEDGEEVALIDLLPDQVPPIDATAIIQIDVRRFIDFLSPPLAEGCEILLADSIAEGARTAGIHRSTAHERIRTLRETALSYGLGVYFDLTSDGLSASPVNGRQGATTGAKPETTPNVPGTRPPRVRLLLTESEFRAWLAQSRDGEVLEYHRGVLVADRLKLASRLPEDERQELDRIAQAAYSVAASGGAYLLQRRHGVDDYSYLIVAGPRAVFARATGLTEAAS